MTKIMLVEDDKGLREIYSIRLTAEGYEVVLASDGEEALATAVKEQPNLILSDVMMPKISGFDMLDILRSTPETKDVKVIMMTALSSEDQRLRGESLGADRYLVKSQVGIEDVVNAVHEVLGDKAAETATPTTPNVPGAAQGAGAPGAGVAGATTVAESAPVTRDASVVSTTPAATVVPGGPVKPNEPTAPAAPSREPLARMKAPEFDAPVNPLNPGVRNISVSTGEKMDALLNDLDDNASATGNTAWPGAAA